jgi:hypothetical protein
VNINAAAKTMKTTVKIIVNADVKTVIARMAIAIADVKTAIVRMVIVIVDVKIATATMVTVNAEKTTANAAVGIMRSTIAAAGMITADVKTKVNCSTK